MTIEIETSDRVVHEIELESNGQTNDNGTEYYHYGETEDLKGEMIKIEVFQHRNHPMVLPSDIIISDNIITSLDLIARQINEQLLDNGD